MNTSARNCFRGKIEFIEKPGLLVEVGVNTVNGLKITSIITETSKNTLNLAIGKTVEAIVKAPQVQIFPLEMAGKTPKDLNNCFQGFITDIKTDGKVMEILATLEKGDKICAVYPDKNLLASEIKVNSQAIIAFSAYAVILMD